MTPRRAFFAVLALVSLTFGIYAQGAGQGTGQGGGRAGGPAKPVPQPKGTLVPLAPDSRGWGWMTKSYVSPTAQRPFYNIAKEKLFSDKQVTSYTITAFAPDFYCEVRKHFDYVWFEMQHSTLSFDEVRRMITACPGLGMAAPMIRMPDALEANIQKAVDLGVLGVIIPTVDDALEARDAARFSRFPPFARRSSGGGAAGTLWADVPGGYRQTINDNFLVVVMLETIESIINADEIANTYGVDVVIQGNNDLSQFSGWAQTDDRYQDLLITSHNATLKAGKYWGNAGAQYLSNGNILSSATRFVQNGPAHDGWMPPSRGGGPVQAHELVMRDRAPNQQPAAGTVAAAARARLSSSKQQ
jgi:2-keto-3-deoxy-L-rhamnonate aldolase RhmA